MPSAHYPVVELSGEALPNWMMRSEVQDVVCAVRMINHPLFQEGRLCEEEITPEIAIVELRHLNASQRDQVTATQVNQHIRALIDGYLLE